MCDGSSETILRSFPEASPRRAILRQAVRLGAGGAALAAFAGRLASASAAETAGLTLQIWGGIVPDIVRDEIGPAFANRTPPVKLAYEIGTSEVIYPKLLVSRSRPTVSAGMFSDTGIYRAISDKMLAPLDPADMPHLAEVSPELILPGRWAVAFVQSPYGIMYNPARVAKPTSWADLWKPEYKGRVALREGYFAEFIGAALAAGRPPQVEEGIKAWAPHKDNIGSWFTASAKAEDDISRGEIWLAPGWGAFTEQARVNGKNIAFSLPQEGGIAYSGYIASFAGFDPNVSALTQTFIDLMLSPGVQGELVRKGFFTPTNRTVQVPPDLLSNAGIMTADDAARQLVPYDVQQTGAHAARILRDINETLK